MQSKVFIVTGAASGIGYATATQLLARGAFVSAGDLRADALANAFRELKTKYDKHLYCRAVDVTQRDQVAGFIAATVKHFGRLDGYANVAGTGGHRLGHEYISELPDEEYDFIMDVNVRATYLALSEALKPEVFQVDGGSIVCVGSMFGRRGFKKGAVFAASKHAMAGMARSVALEAGERGIRINVVEPGAINTPMHQRNMDSNMPDPTPSNPIPRLGEPGEVASVVLFLLGDESRYVTGSTYAVDGGANA